MGHKTTIRVGELLQSMCVCVCVCGVEWSGEVKTPAPGRLFSTSRLAKRYSASPHFATWCRF